MILWFFQYRIPGSVADKIVALGYSYLPQPDNWLKILIPVLSRDHIEMDDAFKAQFWKPAVLAIERLNTRHSEFGPWPYCGFAVDTTRGRVFMTLQGLNPERLDELKQ